MSKQARPSRLSSACSCRNTWRAMPILSVHRGLRCLSLRPRHHLNSAVKFVQTETCTASISHDSVGPARALKDIQAAQQLLDLRLSQSFQSPQADGSPITSRAFCRLQRCSSHAYWYLHDGQGLDLLALSCEQPCPICPAPLGRLRAEACSPRCLEQHYAREKPQPGDLNLRSIWLHSISRERTHPAGRVSSFLTGEIDVCDQRCDSTQQAD